MPSESGPSRMILLLITSMCLIYVLIHILFGVFTQPYFWDELGVYSRSSIHLLNNGLSLMPSAVPDELSRGHPLLCSFYFALAFKLFGCTPFTAHVAAACLNILGFYFCYKILLRYVPSSYAVFGTLTIFVQTLFLSQSLLILPEMPLMVATLGAVMFYIYDKKWAVMYCLVIALQIKESALILPIAFFITDIIINKKLIGKHAFLYLGLPMLSFITFLSIQKFQRGYFFYPLHTSLSSFDMYYIRERWGNFRHFVLHEQGHLIICLIACIVFLIFLIKNIRDIRKLLRHKLILIPIIIIGSVCFLVLNYFLSRYTMYFVVLFYILLILLIVRTFESYKYLQLSLISIIAFNGVYNWNNGMVYTDVDFSYSSHIRSLQSVISELKGDHYKDKTVGMDFPLAFAYWNKESGYNTGTNIRSVPMQDSLPLKDYLVFTHPGNMEDTLQYKEKLILEKEFRSGYAFARIYRVLYIQHE